MTDSASPDSSSIAVVIATRDRSELLRGALQALAKSSRAPGSIVVVDSASSDPDLVASVASTGGATVVRCSRPGTCRARNAGWKSVTEPLVAFIDDDCRVDGDWLEGIVTAFGDSSKPSFVTGRVRPDVAPSERAGLSVAVTDDPEPRILELGDDLQAMGHGANMAWRKEALEAIGGFDEMLGPGAPLGAAEDLDVFWRALVAGCRGFYTPDAVVVHEQWRSRLGMLRAYHGYGIGTGAFNTKRRRRNDSTAERASVLTGLRLQFIDEGLAPVWRALAQRYEMGALAEFAKFLGTLRGAWRARRLTIVDGHFESPLLHVTTE